MDYSTAFSVSAAGMNLERARVEVAAMNLANANTTQAAGEAGYRPMRVVARAPAAADGAFAAAFGAARGEPGGHGPAAGALLPQAVIEPVQAAPRRVHEPGHPMADERGFVTYPGVDPATEMVTLMSATRAYEANVAALNTARVLALKALDIGGAA